MKNKTTTQWLTAACLALGLGGASLAYAQAPAPTDAAATEAAAAARTDGVIKRLDPAAGKLTIQHGPIANLDMPGMTMVFVARDSAALAHLKVGDKIRFVASNEGGKYIASEIQTAP